LDRRRRGDLPCRWLDLDPLARRAVPYHREPVRSQHLDDLLVDEQNIQPVHYTDRSLQMPGETPFGMIANIHSPSARHVQSSPATSSSYPAVILTANDRTGLIRPARGHASRTASGERA